MNELVPHTRSTNGNGKTAVQPRSTASVEAFLEQARDKNEPTVAFVSGTFEVLHPGHLRLLRFAEEQSDILIVGVSSDGICGAHIKQEERLQGVAALAWVDKAFLVDEPLPDVLRRLRPDLVIKGREWANGDNPEAAVVNEYGGQMVFSSGEVTSSSFELLWEEFKERQNFTVQPRRDYLERRSVGTEELHNIFGAFADLNVLVLGDTIVDEYLFCDALGMSQEDPVLVVRPLAEQKYIGGAAIVAMHARGLGANVRFASVVGKDETGEWVEEELTKSGIETRLLRDATRPTTRKLRYISEGKKLLRVSYLRDHALKPGLISQYERNLRNLLDGVDVVIMSDFSYGFLCDDIRDMVLARCEEQGILTAADSQCSSQMGDITRFQGVDLVTPTEREARLALHDQNSGLVVVAQKLQQKMRAGNVILTLGKDGVLVHHPRTRKSRDFDTDNIPALNSHAKDVLGAGDALLVGSAMTLGTGASIWHAAYMGSLCSAYEVSCVGNRPLARNEVMALLTNGAHS